MEAAENLLEAEWGEVVIFLAMLKLIWHWTCQSAEWQLPSSHQLDLSGGRPYHHHCASSCTQGWPRIQVSTVLLDIDIFIIIIIIAVIDHNNRPHRNQAGLHGQRGAELFLRRPRYAWGHQVLAGKNLCFHDFKILAISWGQSPIIMPTSCFHSKYLSSTDKTWPRGFSTALRVTRTTTRMSPFSRNSKIRWQSQEGQHHGLWQQKHNNKTLNIWGQRRNTTRHVRARLCP